ncbi:hypothetical protein V7S43_006796 [Phytophthora oleae]|uniref:Uncharacterized protein n=1 Tax=Phytophthora oleae TaxID=2107226 RepID=A0ABD3FMG2_9STRA
MLSDVSTDACHGSDHLPCLFDIAYYGVRVALTRPLPRQTTHPPNHQSADGRYNVLVKNIRMEQDVWRCIVVDAILLSLWPKLYISPFGVVDIGDSDQRTTGRVIHDLSCPVNKSLNAFTDKEAVCQAKYEHCDSIAAEIIHQQREHPDTEVKEQAGDVASAYGHVSIHNHCGHRFGGRLHRDNALVIDMYAAFGWFDLPGNYGAVGWSIVD